MPQALDIALVNHNSRDYSRNSHWRLDHRIAGSEISGAREIWSPAATVGCIRREHIIILHRLITHLLPLSPTRRPGKRKGKRNGKQKHRRHAEPEPTKPGAGCRHRCQKPTTRMRRHGDYWTVASLLTMLAQAHLQSQLAQLSNNLSDTENLLRMTSVQAEAMRGLGSWHGGL